ncbi:MAG: rhomboid family intramembrane serine protease [Dorea sp.]|nr:rhomboid family intramembrane serine protease [Dorea sp.]
MRKNGIKAPCTVILVAINVVVFLLLSLKGMTEDGMFLLQHGAMYVPYITEEGEYYRIFTSMFLHFGFDHLLNNMVVLAAVGWNLEYELGGLKFLILYLLSGLGGNVLSAWWDIRMGEYAISAGASGAIFGVIGALLYVAIRNKGRIGDISGRGILFMIALSLYYGFSSGGVDNMAHIGGLAAGFVLSVLLYRKKDRKYRSVSWS